MQIDVRGAAGRSKGVPGSISGLKLRRTGPEILIFTIFLPPFLGRAHLFPAPYRESFVLYVRDLAFFGPLPRGPLKGPRGPFRGPRGPLKVSQRHPRAPDEGDEARQWLEEQENELGPS